MPPPHALAAQSVDDAWHAGPALAALQRLAHELGDAGDAADMPDAYNRLRPCLP